MSKHDAVQHGQEQACVEAFLTWLGQNRNACYAYERAEDLFGREGQWEFVVRSTGGEEWIGIEVKSLVIQEWEAQPSGWDRFCRLLTKELRTLSYSQPMGEFFLSTEVPWSFSQGQSKVLRDVITQVLSSMTADLPVGQECDLTSIVGAKLPGWPRSSAMHNGRSVLCHSPGSLTHPSPQSLTHPGQGDLYHRQVIASIPPLVR
jgi:hypothetical protein